MDDLTYEEIEKIDAYGRALFDLMLSDRKYNSNYATFKRWDGHQRLWWINKIEADARAGKQTIGAIVVAHVVVLQLRGNPIG